MENSLAKFFLSADAQGKQSENGFKPDVWTAAIAMMQEKHPGKKLSVQPLKSNMVQL